MRQAALAAMEFSLDLTAADRVLVVTRPQDRHLRRGLRRGPPNTWAATRKPTGCPRRIVRCRPCRRVWASCSPGRTVVVNAMDGDAQEIPFRLEWIRLIDADENVRLGHSPGIDEDMMLHGPLNIDYGPMGERADHLLAALDRRLPPAHHLASRHGSGIGRHRPPLRFRSESHGRRGREHALRRDLLRAGGRGCRGRPGGSTAASAAPERCPTR